MNFQFQSSKKNKKKFIPIFVVVIFVGLVILITAFAPRFFRGMTFASGRPIWNGGNFLSLASGSIRALLSSKQDLVNENRSLRDQLDDAKNHLFELDILKNENEELKKIRGLDEEIAGVVATVLSKPPQSLYDTIILDVGERRGLAAGDLAVLSDTIFLGTADQVFSNTSRIKLLSSVGTETAAIIERNGIAISLVGKGGGSFEMRLPQDVDIVVDDLITVPGTKTRLVAKVIDIESTPTDSFKRVFCKTPVNVSQLRFVSVVKP